MNAERDVFGFSTILSLNFKLIHKQKNHEFLQQIYDYVLKKSEQHCKQHQEFKQILSRKNVGILMTERFINLPGEVIPNLFTELPDDLTFTKKQSDIKDPREFDY